VQPLLDHELMGPRSNLFLLDGPPPAGVALARSAAANQSRLRPIAAEILQPSARPQGDLPSQSRGRWDGLAPPPLAVPSLPEGPQQTYQGISPALALATGRDQPEQACQLLAMPVERAGGAPGQELCANGKRCSPTWSRRCRFCPPQAIAASRPPRWGTERGCWVNAALGRLLGPLLARQEPWRGRLQAEQRLLGGPGAGSSASGTAAGPGCCDQVEKHQCPPAAGLSTCTLVVSFILKRPTSRPANARSVAISRDQPSTSAPAAARSVARSTHG